jgi:hypothetical protein
VVAKEKSDGQTKTAGGMESEVFSIYIYKGIVASTERRRTIRV